MAIAAMEGDEPRFGNAEAKANSTLVLMQNWDVKGNRDHGWTKLYDAGNLEAKSEQFNN